MSAGAPGVIGFNWRSRVGAWEPWLSAVAGAAGIVEFSFEPQQAVFSQLDGPLPCFRWAGLAGIVAAQELHKRRGKLLGGSAGSLTFKGVPIAIANRQGALQLLGQMLAVIRPLTLGSH